MSLATAQPRRVATPNTSLYYNTILPLVVLAAALLGGASVGFAGYLALSSIGEALL